MNMQAQIDPTMAKVEALARKGYSPSAIKTIVGRFVSEAEIGRIFASVSEETRREKQAESRRRQIEAGQRELRETKRIDRLRAVSLYREVPVRTQMSAKQIIDDVCQEAGLTVFELLGESRFRPLVRARWKAMYLIALHTQLSLPVIGRIMGGRDHTTILHGVRGYARINGFPLPRGMHHEGEGRV